VEVKVRWLNHLGTVTTMEAEEETYNFRLDLRKFESSYNDTKAYFTYKDDESLLLSPPFATKSMQVAGNYYASSFNQTQQEIQVVAGTNVTVGDFLYHGSEAMEVTGVATGGAYDIVEVTRGYNYTHSEAIFNGDIITNRPIILGREAYILDPTGTYPVRYVYVKNVQTVGAGYEVTFSDVFNKYNKAIPLLEASTWEGVEWNSNIDTTPLVDWNLYDIERIMGKYKFPFFDLRSADYVSELGYAKLYPDAKVTDKDLTFNPVDIIDIIRKLNNSYLIFNPNKGSYTNASHMRYKLVNIQALTVLDSTPSVALSDKILMEKGYQFTKINIGYTVNIKYKFGKDNDNTYEGTITRSGFGGDTGESIDIDLSNYLNNAISTKEELLMACDTVLANYKALYSRTVGTLVCDIPYEEETLEVGAWYELADPEKFDILLDTSYSVYLYLISKDNDEFTFLVTQTEKTAYVGLTMVCNRNNPDSVVVPSIFIKNEIGGVGPYEGFDETEWRRREIPDTVLWTTGTFSLFDAQTMELLGSGLSIDTVSLVGAVGSEELEIVFTTLIDTIDPSTDLLLVHESHPSDLYITEGSGV